MKTVDRELPKNIYPSVTPGRVIAVIRHKRVRHHLGTFDTVDDAQARIDLFHEHHPRVCHGSWEPGDVL